MQPLLIALLAVGVVVATACAPGTVVLERGPQAHYQTGFPVHDTSRELERAFRSLQRITYSAEYDTYVFSADAGVTEADLADPAVLERAVDRFADVSSKAGTAVIIGRAGERVALVTNDHVVRHPPMVIHHFDDGEARGAGLARRVASVAVLAHASGRLTGYPELGSFAVLARDSASDIAILEVRLPDRAAAQHFPPLTIPPGDPRRLSWGSFVYVLGYPSGYAMVTRAIVSDPDRDGMGGFLTDGLWNEGISGGAILGVRGDDGRLEWVGMTRAGAGSREVRLQPRGDERPTTDAGVLYDGPIYAEPTLRILYGITLSVPMTRIQRFVDEQSALLRRRGYELTGF